MNDRRQVLVVDDHREFLDVTGALLKFTGFAVLAANSAAEAIEHLRRERIDALLVDVLMPGVDGIALATEARGLLPGLKIALMSVMSRQQLLHLGKDVGDFDFLEKIAQSNALVRFLNS